MTDYTDDQLAIMHLEEELNSALRHLAMALIGDRKAVDMAWWLCANHPAFIIDHPNLDAEARLISMATAAGTPPRGEPDWCVWFERVRNLSTNGPIVSDR